MGPRLSLAIGVGKGAGWLSRRIGAGGGTALPGLLAETIDPESLSALARQLPEGCVFVSGTNGKTTTVHILSALLRRAGFSVFDNPTGSNLSRGIVTSLLQSASLAGGLPRRPKAIGLFEVDEAALPGVIQLVPPRLIVLTNLFRDQLDRYGEVDLVAEGWRNALGRLPQQATIVLNSDDPTVGGLALGVRAPVLFFGIEDEGLAREAISVAADARFCPRCQGSLQYERVFYSHMGQYRCVNCGYERPQPDFRATHVRLDGIQGSDFRLEAPEGKIDCRVHLPGIYNLANALAASAAYLTLAGNIADIPQVLEETTPAFGRGERLTYKGKELRILLVKNPTGLTEVIHALLAQPGPKHLLLALNDGIADGQDISWIWDAEVERLQGEVETVVAGGNRAEDMALRVKYAGVVSDPTVEPDLEQALSAAVERLRSDESLYVLPTYTAMLELQNILTRAGVTSPYWERSRQ
jgi:UDP-N-acetylmuramyl tripeptide synthase